MQHLISRLEALTDLTEFAEQRRAKGSPYVAGWENTKAWKKTIEYLRSVIPEDVLEEFDDYRKRKRDMFSKMD